MAIYLVFNSPVNVKSLQDSKMDFYIAKTNKGQEIHLKGYSPVYYNSNESYVNEDNFIWGIKSTCIFTSCQRRSKLLGSISRL